MPQVLGCPTRSGKADYFDNLKKNFCKIAKDGMFSVGVNESVSQSFKTFLGHKYNKLGVCHWQTSLAYSWVRPGAYQEGATERCFARVGSGLTQNIRLG